jgi:hypothetical protein
MPRSCKYAIASGTIFCWPAGSVSEAVPLEPPKTGVRVYYGEQELSDSASRSVADEFVLKEVLHDVGTALRGAKVGADTADNLGASSGAPTLECIGLHVVVEQFVGVEVRSVGRQEEDLDAVAVILDPPTGRRGLVSRVMSRIRKTFLGK